MNSAVNFIIESGISLAMLAIIYILFLRRDTFFRVNRLFLLGAILFSVILPFLKLRILSPQPVVLSEITVTPYRNLIEAVTVYSHDLSGSLERAILSIDLLVIAYIAGVLFFLGRFLFRIFQLIFIIRKNSVQKMTGFKLVFLEKQISPFSFLDYVFVHPATKEKDSYERMLAHELEHVKQGHSVDVIILELLTVFQWFNPFMWMLSRAIRENHEYLADQAVLVSGVNRGYYKKLLLEQISGGQLVIANNFNYSIIKKRIKMMSKIKSSKLAITKTAIGILVAAALIVAFACEQKESLELNDNNDLQTEVNDISVKSTILEDGTIRIEGTPENVQKYVGLLSEISRVQLKTDAEGNKILIIEKGGKEVENKQREDVKSATTVSGEEVFFIVEDMPEFPGGEMELRKYIANAVKYPEEAQKKGMQGKVYVMFTVTKEGGIADAKIARGVDPSLDQEALRVINSLPKWKPGKQRGTAVNVQYTVPINFVLQ